jgi:TolB protein
MDKGNQAKSALLPMVAGKTSRHPRRAGRASWLLLSPRKPLYLITAAHTSFMSRLIMLAFLAFGVVASSATATFRGKNGLIALVRGGGDTIAITAMSPDGNNEVTLAHGGFAPAWSPDGKRIAYVGRSRGRRDLYVADADGSHVRRLVRARMDECDPSWSPTGRRILFVLAYDCTSGDGPFWIATIKPDGSGLRRLLRGPPFFSPAWSPDGKWIAYICTDQPTMSFSYNDLCLMHSNGKGARWLTPHTRPDEGSPSWSPDGKQLLYDRGDLFVRSMTTGRTRLLLGGPSDDVDPVWSPDGKRIAFTRITITKVGEEIRTSFDVYTMTKTGQTVRLLARDAFEPDWQPLRR